MEHDETEGVAEGLPEGAVADHAAEGSEHASGLPQLDVSTFDNQIFWMLVALVAIFLILTRIALPRIGAVLAERQGTITNDIAAAEDLKRQAAEAEAAYDKALAEARAEAQEIANQARADIQADLDEATARADARIAEQTAESEARIAEIRAGAAVAVEEVARDTALEILRAFGPTDAPDASRVEQAVTARMGDNA